MGNGDRDTRPAIEAYPSVAREGARPQELAAVAADLHNLASLYEAKGGVETHHVYRQREWYALAAPPLYAISRAIRRAFCFDHGDNWIAGYQGRNPSQIGGGGYRVNP